MLGKWHLTKDAHLSDGAPKASWPLQRGFDRYYGILDAFTNFHQPHRLYEDNHHHRRRRLPRRLLLHRRPHRPGHAHGGRAAVLASEPAVLHVLRPRRGARPVAGPGGRHRAVPRPFRRGLGRAERSALRAPAPAWRGAARRGAAAPQHRGAPRGRPLGRARRPVQGAVRPLHGGVRGHGPQRRPQLRTAAPPPGGHRRVGQHHRVVHQRQRRLPGGPVHRHVGLLPHAAHQVWNTESGAGGHRLRAHRPARRAPDVGPLPDGLGHGVVHPVPALQDQHPPGRPQRAVHRQLAGPVRSRRRVCWPAACAPSTSTSPTCSRPWPSCAAWRFPPAATACPRRIRPGPASRPRSPTRRRRPPIPSSTTRCSGTAASTATAGRWSPATGPGAPSARTAGSCTTWPEDPTESRRPGREHPDKLDEMQQAWDRAAWANQVFPLDEGNQLVRILRPPWYESWPPRRR